MKNKDKQRIYIRGVEGRGKEVIKMLEDLGGKVPPLDLGGNPRYIYFISHDGDITCALHESEAGKIIMDFYREIGLPEKWKDGDVLYIPESEAFVVFQCYVYMDDIGRNHFFTYISVDENNLYIKDTKPFTGNPRLATPSEVEHFHELLHVHGKDWNAEKKQLVDWKWKPKDGDTVYYFDEIGQILSDRFDDFSNGPLLDFGNCFQTKEEAEAAAERVRKALKGE